MLSIRLLPLALTVLSSLAIAQSTQPYNLPKIAATPPMGLNSWNWFAEKVTDQDVRQAADLLASFDMRDAGHVYVNIDDIWEGERDASTALTRGMGKPGFSGSCVTVLEGFIGKRQTKRMAEVFAAQAAGVSSAMR